MLPHKNPFCKFLPQINFNALMFYDLVRVARVNGFICSFTTQHIYYGYTYTHKITHKHTHTHSPVQCSASNTPDGDVYNSVIV